MATSFSTNVGLSALPEYPQNKDPELYAELVRLRNAIKVLQGALDGTPGYGGSTTLHSIPLTDNAVILGDGVSGNNIKPLASLGTAGFVLTSAGAGVPPLFAPAAGGFANPMITLGDIITGGAAGAGTRLGIGSSGNVLKVIAGVPAWGTSPGSVVLVGPQYGDLSGDFAMPGTSFAQLLQLSLVPFALSIPAVVGDRIEIQFDFVLFQAITGSTSYTELVFYINGVDCGLKWNYFMQNPPAPTYGCSYRFVKTVVAGDLSAGSVPVTIFGHFVITNTEINNNANARPIFTLKNYGP